MLAFLIFICYLVLNLQFRFKFENLTGKHFWKFSSILRYGHVIFAISLFRLNLFAYSFSLITILFPYPDSRIHPPVFSKHHRTTIATICMTQYTLQTREQFPPFESTHYINNHICDNTMRCAVFYSEYRSPVIHRWIIERIDLVKQLQRLQLHTVASLRYSI